MRTGCRILLSAIHLLTAGCGGGEFELPPQAGNSEFINYYTDVDVSVVCLDDLLAREDAFIENTAARLEVPPPAPIDFVWDPVMNGSDPWSCPDTPACYRSQEGNELSVVVSTTLPQHHELVHAVEVQALGQGGHPVLVEGLAEYLGSLNLTLPRDDFSQVFKAMLAESTEPDYRLSMHFIGMLFSRHGAAKYKALRANMPKDAGLERFAEVFETVYDQSLDAALGEMNGKGLTALGPFAGCDGEAPVLPWTNEGLLEATIDGSCGDPWFYGGGFVPGGSGFLGYYTIDVAQSGTYELKVGGVADGPVPSLSGVTACSFEQSRVASRMGEAGRGVLLKGLHTLVIVFPQRPEARGEAVVRLELVGPVV